MNDKNSEQTKVVNLITRGDITPPEQHLWRTFAARLADAMEEQRCDSPWRHLARQVLREMGDFEVEELDPQLRNLRRILGRRNRDHRGNVRSAELSEVSNKQCPNNGRKGEVVE
jgi:hypothetical protein